MSTTSATRSYLAAATISPQVIRPGRASLRTTFQLAANLAVSDPQSADAAFSGAARAAIDWLEKRFPQPLPSQSRNLEEFDLDHHGQQQVSCISLPEDGLWSARLVHPDAPFSGRPAVAGRTWTTEFALHRADSRVRMGIRVLCASAPYAVEPIALTRPRLVVDLAAQFGLSEIRTLNDKPWILQTEEDLRSLQALLNDAGRTLPVILLTQPDRRQWKIGIADYVLDPSLLAQQTQGFAHVVCMPMDLGFTWTNMVGKVWSAFHGAIRTYYPRLNLQEDSPFAHPRVLPDRVLFWRYNEQEGESGFASFLIDKMAEHAATKSVEWGNCLFFADARTRRAEVLRERIKHDVQQQSHVQKAGELRTQIDALQKAHDEEVKALKAKIAEAQRDAEEYDDLASQYKTEAERYGRENRSLQFQNDALRTAVEAKTGRSADDDAKIPENYDDMADWVESRLAGRLALHPRGVQGLKKAQYGDIQLVYQCLMLLAREYRNMRLAYEGAKTAWGNGLTRLKMRFDRSITKERAGEQGDTYFVRYPLGSNHRQFLELHLRKGSSKDEKLCLAICFFWDDDTSQVIVGWLPSHLDTRAT